MPLCLGVLLFIACTPNNHEQDTPYAVINLSDKVTEVKQLPLSDAVQKVDIVPLETTDESLINDLTFVEISDKFIFVYQLKNSEILRFARDGKFLNKIGKKGQGPGEYTYISGLQIDENKGEVYAITTANGVLVYDFEGRFKRQIIDHTSLKKYSSSITNIQYLLSNDHFFYTQTLPFFKPATEDSIWSVTVVDNQFQIKNTFCNPAYQEQIETINKNLVGKGNNYLTDYPISMDSYHNEVTLKYPDTDTIYIFDQATQQLKPQFTIYSNEPKGEYEKTHLWIKEREAFNYLSVYSYYPSKEFIYLVGSKSDEIYTFAFNKTNGTVKLHKKQSSISEYKMP